MPVFLFHCRLCTFGLFFIAFSGLVSGSSNHSFVKDVAFNERLPINSAVYYMETNDGTVSRSHCGARCSSKGSKCAGLLYNHLTRTCHVLKSRLYERSVDKTIVKAGWELFITSQNGNNVFVTPKDLTKLKCIMSIIKSNEYHYTSA